MLRITSLLLALSLALGMVEQANINDPEWTAFKAKYKKSYKDADDEQARAVLCAPPTRDVVVVGRALLADS